MNASASQQTLQTWSIGAAATNDIVIAQPSVSGMHCRLAQTDRGFTLVDLGSTNGTYVDGVPLTPREPVPVTRAQTITLARTVPFPWDRIQLQTQPKRAAQSSGSRGITVGSMPGSDVEIDYPVVSRNHARVFEQDGRFFIEDLGSTNGTFLHQLGNRVQGPTPLQPGDTVFLGSYKVSADRLLAQFTKDHATAIGDGNFQQVTLTGDSMVIGRDPACDQPLDYPMISWRHARITRRPDGIFVEDLGSKNGTFVNGRRISGATRVEPGKQIALGSFRFEVLAGGSLAKRFDRGYTVEARDLTVSGDDGSQILAPISFTVFAGELVALMGTSGAGKTTLLKALNGYTPPAGGSVFYNGQNLYEFYEEYSQKVGYVPQDDIVHARLTVREALTYSARLRTALSPSEIQAKAERIVSELGLSDKIDKEIGSPEDKKLSGGQRKRVNIALELMCDTPVLFLDEPTSGLSSADADSVVRLLKRLAHEEGKTIITTIHSPSLQAYRDFDNLLMLARDKDQPGTMVFYGPAYPDSIQYVSAKGAASAGSLPPTVGPEVLMSTLQQDDKNPDPANSAAVWRDRFRGSKFFRQFVQERAGKSPSTATKTPAVSERRKVDLMQWLELAGRNWRVRWRDKGQLWIMALQAPLFALLIFAIFRRLPESFNNIQAAGCPPSPAGFWDTVPMVGGIHFLMVVAAVWFGCNNAVRDIVGEWLIYQRERMVCLQLPSYVVSKLSILSVISLVQCLLLLGIVYPLCNLHSGFWMTLLVLWVTSMVGAAIGLLISAAPFCRSTESAIAVLPIVLLPMIGLGGGIRAVYQMKEASFASNLVASRWAFEANLVREAEQRGEHYHLIGEPVGQATGDIAEVNIPTYVKDGRPSTRLQGGDPNRTGLARCLIALCAMFVLFVAGVLASLRYRDVH